MILSSVGTVYDKYIVEEKLKNGPSILSNLFFIKIKSILISEEPILINLFSKWVLFIATK
jgi:hypothetical protein